MVSRLVVSVLVILVTVATLTTGTLAWFHDEATSRESSMRSGTLDLQLRDWGPADPDGWSDTVDRTWDILNMVPGQSTTSNTINLREVGSVEADHVEIQFTHVIDEARNPVESDTNPASSWRDMAKWLEITNMVYDGYALRDLCFDTPGWDANGNGWLDLEDVASEPLASDGGVFDNLPTPRDIGGQVDFAMSVRFRAEATNDIQGDTLITTVSFTLNQHSSQ